MKKQKNIMPTRRLLCCCTFLVYIALFTGCGSSTTASVTVLPDFSYLLETNADSINDSDSMNGNNENGDDETVVSMSNIPVRIYMDNTGSTKGFVIDEDGKWNSPDSNFVRFMRSLRDFGRTGIYSSSTYVLSSEERDWVEYDNEAFFEDYGREEFYIGWNGTEGPLSLLYFDDESADSIKCVNIVLTDLSEQGMNNTLLASRMKALCEEQGYETALFAFKFDFHANTQVPNPDTLNGMLEARVDGQKPYYMIVTGPGEYMDVCVTQLKQQLSDEGLIENADFYYASTVFDIRTDTAGIGDVVFSEFADYEDIKEEINQTNQEIEAEATDGGVVRKSKNLEAVSQYDLDALFEEPPECDFVAFQYSLVAGIPKRNSDLRLCFYLPLSGSDDPDISYSISWTVYTLQEETSEEKNDAGASSGDNSEDADDAMDDKMDVADEANLCWVLDTGSRIQLVTEKLTEFDGKSEEIPSALLFAVTDADTDKNTVSWETAVLLIIRVEREEIISWQRPSWLDEFDSGSTGDYFTHTYNLSGFYDVLVGYKDILSTEGSAVLASTYAELPIILLNLEE